MFNYYMHTTVYMACTYHVHTADVWVQNSLLSSMIVTAAWSGFRVTCVGALERCTVNVSLFSSLLSSIIGILIVCIVAPGVKVMIPLVEL